MSGSRLVVEVGADLVPPIERVSHGFLVGLAKDPLVVDCHNPHLKFTKLEKNDAILFGDPISSRKFERPLLFDKKLARGLSFN